MLHLLAGFGYFIYKLEFQKNNKKQTKEDSTTSENKKLDNSSSVD
jgi:hypothetical protein